MALSGFINYIRNVREEAGKVTWASRKETIQLSIMVFVMVLVMSLFFFVVDQVLRLIFENILG